MSEEHWLVIGLAHPRAGWFRQMASWATTATVPLDFVKCVSAEEIRARIASGRPYSAALLGSDAVGLDAGLIDLVTTTGAAAIVVGDGRDRDWRSAGATATLQTPFDRADLVAVLSEHAPPAATLAVAGCTRGSMACSSWSPRNSQPASTSASAMPCQWVSSAARSISRVSAAPQMPVRRIFAFSVTSRAMAGCADACT